MKNFLIINICALFVSLFLVSNLPANQGEISVIIKDTSGHKVGLYEGSHALLIGVSNYTAGWPKLHSVPNELKQVEALLKKQGFHVIKVMDPTNDALREAFEDFIDNYGFDQDNRLFFFFSGHGHTRRGGEKGYLVPTDAPNPNKDRVGFLRKALPMNQILAWSRHLEAKHALFLFDSCFSGTVFKAKDLPESPPHISRATALPVRQYITAGDAGERVPAKSVFTPAFIDALDYGWGDLNGDGYVSGTELGLYLQEKVPQHSNQNPQYGKIRDYELTRGDFIFALKGSSTPQKSYDRFREERKQLEQEKRELGRLKTEIERKKLEEERKRLEAEKKKYATAKLPPKPKHLPVVATDLRDEEIAHDGRFVAYANGIVRDTKTGLEWMAGPDRNMDWRDAESWVKGLNADGRGWRMPTTDELEGLYKKGAGSRNRTSLLKNTGWYVWSGEGSNNSAYFFAFDYGAKTWDVSRQVVRRCRAFAVRSQKKTNSSKPGKAELGNLIPESAAVAKDEEIDRDGRFIAYANGTVLDTRTNLMWAAGDDGKGLLEHNVKDYIANYRRGGHTDWRLPTMEELEMIYDRDMKNEHGYHVTKLIHITGELVWGYEGWGNTWVFDFSRGSPAVGGYDGRNWSSHHGGARALLVRAGK